MKKCLMLLSLLGLCSTYQIQSAAITMNDASPLSTTDQLEKFYMMHKKIDELNSQNGDEKMQSIHNLALDPFLEEIYNQDHLKDYSFPKGITLSSTDDKLCKNSLILNEVERIKKNYGTTKKIRVFIDDNLVKKYFNAGGGAFGNDMIILNPNEFPESTASLSLFQKYALAHEVAHLHYNHPALVAICFDPNAATSFLDTLPKKLSKKCYALIESCAESKSLKNIKCSDCLEQLMAETGDYFDSTFRKDNGYYTRRMVQKLAQEFRQHYQACPDHTTPICDAINPKIYLSKAAGLRTTGALILTGLLLSKLNAAEHASKNHNEKIINENID